MSIIAHIKKYQFTIAMAGMSILASACPPAGGGGPDFSFLALLGMGSSTPAQTYTVGGSVTGLGGGQDVTIQLNSSESITITSNTSFTFSTDLENTASYSVLTTGATGTNCVASANTGTIASSNVSDVAVHCSTTLYTLRVNVTGMDAANTFVVQNNGTNDTTVSANGITSFTATVPSGSDYSVTVKTQPAINAQVCTPSSNTGTMDATPKTIAIACSPDFYTVSGTFSGLAGDGLQIRLNNTGETATKNKAGGAAGAFAFTGKVADGATYTVSVNQNPSNLNQTCVVTNGTGTVSGGNITNVSVACTTNQFTVGGSISGMTAGNSITLIVNGASNQTITYPNTAFSWNLTDGVAYTVAVQTHAANKTCSVTNATGTMAGANVTNVSVNCAFNTYTVGGNVSGLCGGQSITLQNNAGNDQLVTGSTSFTFPAIDDLSAYSVTVKSGSVPAGVSCSVTSGGSGNIASANVTNVVVSCSGCSSCASGQQFTVSWPASRSYDVKTATGGGHRIYYSTSSGITTATPDYLDIANSTSTTTGVVTGRTSGCTYYVRVQPYSALRAAGASGANLSAENNVTTP